MKHNNLSIFIANEFNKSIGFDKFISMPEGIKVSFCPITNNPIFTSASTTTGIGSYGIPLVDECELFINTSIADSVIGVLNNSHDDILASKLLIKEISTQVYRQIQSINWQSSQIKVFNEKIVASFHEISLIEKELQTEGGTNVHH
jgi:hypothetical protein